MLESDLELLRRPHGDARVRPRRRGGRITRPLADVHHRVADRISTTLERLCDAD